MTSLKKLVTLFTLLLSCISLASAFSIKHNNKPKASPSFFFPSSASSFKSNNEEKTLKIGSHASMAGAVSAMLLPVVAAYAETDAAEISELPPPYVPVVVAVVLLGGVGLLTNSLGDVLADEASLGERSGARAKKEMDRSRSSYFKK